MDSSIAQMNSVLKVDTNCEVCRTKIYKVLQNIFGVYKVNIDAEQGTVKVSGKVNPSALLAVLEGSGKHAELKSVTFDGEVKELGYNYSGQGGYGYGGYGYGYGHDPYAVAPYPYPPSGGFDYQWQDPGRLIMMPLSAPPPLPLPSSSSIPMQSQPPQPPRLLAPPTQSTPQAQPPPHAPVPGSDVANKAVKSEFKSCLKSKCTIM